MLTSAQAKAPSASWDWQVSPKSSQWKEFMEASPAQHSTLWKQAEKKGLSFEQMAWEWRMAWVRSCVRRTSLECSRILQLGLFDKAMVVRAEAASRLGERFAGTGHPPVIRILTTAYSVQQNNRGEKPLFVQYRILHALKKIGGEGTEVGRKLALNTTPTKDYWLSLAGTKTSGPQ